MLGFVQSWFVPGAHPIGIDFGTDSLRMAQVEFAPNGEPRLVAAASAEVPTAIRDDAAARLTFFTQTVRSLLTHGSFRGRRAILSLPAASMHIRHLRLPQMEEPALRESLPSAARSLLPFDPSHALLRHLIAGEVRHDNVLENEVILVAAQRETVDQLLAAATKARLDVIGMSVEPKAIIDCFAHVYRRKTDAETTSCYIDMGCMATRAVIARGTQVLFARVLPIGGEDFSRAVASSLHIAIDDARVLRIKTSHAPPGEEQRHKEPLEGARGHAEGRAPETQTLFTPEDKTPKAVNASAITTAPAPATCGTEVAEDELTRQSHIVDEACRATLTKLVDLLTECRRHHESTFPGLPIDRLIFVGGEARQRNNCRKIAHDLDLPAQIGDPLVRIGRISDVGIESGIDRRLPQPAWVVAVGLSMGPISKPDAHSKVVK